MPTNERTNDSLLNYHIFVLYSFLVSIESCSCKYSSMNKTVLPASLLFYISSKLMVMMARGQPCSFWHSLLLSRLRRLGNQSIDRSIDESINNQSINGAKTEVSLGNIITGIPDTYRYRPLLVDFFLRSKSKLSRTCFAEISLALILQTKHFCLAKIIPVG